MANARLYNDKFTPTEAFVLECFMARHFGKSWGSMERKDGTFAMTAKPDGMATKKIKIMKKDTESFHVEITSSHFVLAHMDWISSLPELLMRMELELCANNLQEARQ